MAVVDLKHCKIVYFYHNNHGRYNDEKYDQIDIGGIHPGIVQYRGMSV